MISKNKIRKLIFDPNRFFFDYFSKRIGGGDYFSPKVYQYLIPPGFVFEEKIHPWIQISKKFNLRAGATTGYPDQSLLLDCHNLLDFLIFTLWIAHGFKSEVKIYTLGGEFQAIIAGTELLNPKKAEWIFSKIYKKSDFVIELLGEFDNNFAAHLFIYDKDSDGLLVIRSRHAFVKKSLPSAFERIYPSVIDKLGGYAFSLPFPVDVVFTWVNKDDIEWKKMWNKTFPDQTFDPDRYLSRDELRFSLRAICKFLPWFNKIYIVSNCVQPDWLKDHPQVCWVVHEDIFPDTLVLPTFNSHAIESCLHRINGLSVNFIYFNDDFFVNQPCYYNDFFDSLGRSISNLESHGAVFEENLYDQSRDYLAPSIKSQVLIERKISGYTATRLHRHTPYALRRDVLEEIESHFKQEISETRSARLRSINDINIASFMYHHYAIASGRATCGDLPSLILRPSNTKIAFDMQIKKYKFLCFNDGDGSAINQKFASDFSKYMNDIFPIRGSFEKRL
jgi:hypothetical protein